MYKYKESLLLINPEEKIVTFAFINGLNANMPESEVLKFRNQWSYFKTMKELREYAQSHVNVEDFKNITRGLQKGHGGITF